MPVPNADLYDKQQDQLNGTPSADPAVCTSSEQSNTSSYIGSSPPAGASQNADGGRTLSKEEADRLYEERMEEEYAKREGGA
ncbi:uncharacterized protein N7515_003516 [Penicillium bovifimosum]|uniref:Uncharacterized protein n=1 Tax=Penicillium bovifimosum TaxID=126998 RepID=A0A9W9H582_9EURO|nr:uncharacterized protein N7515_003516 [Penicillium bovifimosum]KAJ5138668.1 hypothetical protein N7515_003516 [Penicillium bovifimosum]